MIQQQQKMVQRRTFTAIKQSKNLKQLITTPQGTRKRRRDKNLQLLVENK